MDTAVTTQFEKLISPISSDDFFANYWEKKPLFIQRHDNAYYDEIIKVEDINNIISRPDARYPSIKLIRQGDPDKNFFDEPLVPPDLYTFNVTHGSDVFSGMIDTQKVASAYQSGLSIALPGLHHSWEALGELCNTLESQFNHAVRANAYITPGNSKAFPLHYDTHEVLVLQIGGKKHWRVYEAPMHLPLVVHQFDSQGYTLPEPLLDMVVEPGDFLYMPRGYVHGAATMTDEFSAHVTIGITPYTWIDLAAPMFMSLTDSPEFRRALPPGFATQSELKGTLKEGLIKVLDELKEHGDFDKFVDTFIRRSKADKDPHKGTYRKTDFKCNVRRP